MSSAFTVRLDPETLERLDQLSARTDRSRSWLVTQAVQDYVALNAWQLEKIETGIAEANRGEFALDEEVTRVRRKFSGTP
jgi:predicted transcriptional regulator